MEESTKKNIGNENVSEFSSKDFLRLCLVKWWWFAMCIALAVGIALFYIYRQQPKFKRFEQILVTDQESNGGIGEISNSFSSLGLFSKNTNVYNELITMLSPAIMYEVADSLQLDMNYSVRDGLRSKTLYGSNLPFRVDLLDVESQQGAALRLKVNEDGSMTAFKFVSYTDDGKIKHPGEVKIAAGERSFVTPLGRIKISPNPRYDISKFKSEGFELRLSKMPMQTTVEYYGKQLYGDLVDQDADVIELSIEDVSVQRAVDILECIIIVYNRDWIADKNRMAVATSLFIDERLKAIQEELGGVDRNIADYMKNTGITNITLATQANLELGSRVEEEAIKAATRLDLAQSLQEFIAKEDNIDALIPADMGIESQDLALQIANYNELLLTRNSIMESSSAKNPLVLNYDKQLREMRSTISHGIDNQVSRLKDVVASYNREMNKMAAKMSKVPEENLPLLSEERRQMVKENLYLFLLQKKEENELTRKFSADNIRIITPPVGSLKPVSPKKALIIIVASILGLGIPFLVLYYLEASNSRIRSRKDLESLDIPFAGEIPQVGKKKKKPETESLLSVVREGKRDVINEAFRVVRGNIDFMSGRNKLPQVIMITSFNPGSGKSFIAYNLALSFCLKQKRVLLVDCDMRHGSASLYAGKPGKGLSAFLSGETDDWQSLLIHPENETALSVLPVGKLPPNPAELLENDRLETLIDEAKKYFDIVFLDCPPVDIVVDTQLVSQWADRTLFIVRAGLLEKKALKELDEFYKEKRFKNMSVILNGTEALHSRYYTYGNYQNLDS